MDDGDGIDGPGAEPFELWDLVPAPLRGVLPNVRWDRDALFGLSLPVEEVPVDELRWQLDLPWWRDGDRHFAVTPNQVRADPVRHHVQWSRTLEADLRFPIHLLATTDVLRVLDGLHRLLKADCRGELRIRARRVGRDDFRQVVCGRTSGRA